MNSLSPVAIRSGLAGEGLTNQSRNKRNRSASYNASPIENELNDAFIDSLESEEAHWFPVRFEPLESFEEIREHLRRRETHSASVELLISLSWLNQAARVAKTEARICLQKAVLELQRVSDGVDLGRPVSLDGVDLLLAMASNALARWHFDRAEYFWGEDLYTGTGTGNNLVMAATFMRYSSTLLNVALSKETVDTVFKTFRYGTLYDIEVQTHRYWTARDFEVIKTAIHDLDTNMRSGFAIAS